MKTSTTILVLLLLLGAAGGCGDTPVQPTPTPTPTPPPVVLAIFTDPLPPAGTTSDVLDAQDEIVRFDVTSGSLIWAADNRMFPGYPVSGGYFLTSSRSFQVRFGTLPDGQRRAYFTETDRATICDISVVNGALVILPTDKPVPGGG